eukprot:8617808-Alexandrium_andersonii.AAC.1
MCIRDRVWNSCHRFRASVLQRSPLLTPAQAVCPGGSQHVARSWPGSHHVPYAVRCLAGGFPLSATFNVGSGP